MSRRDHDGRDGSYTDTERRDQRTRQQRLAELGETLASAGLEAVLVPPRPHRRPWSLTIRGRTRSRRFWPVRRRVTVYCGGADGAFVFVTATGIVLGQADQVESAAVQL